MIEDAPQPRDPRVGLAGLSCAETIAALRQRQAALVRAEAAVVASIAAVGDLYGMSATDVWEPVDPRNERFRRGPEGMPEFSEFAGAAVGPVLGCSIGSADYEIRSVLVLRHRHPRMWQAVIEARMRSWQAKKIIGLTGMAELTLECAHWVDEQLAPVLGKVTFQRLAELATGLVVAADTAAAEKRRLAHDRARYVRMSMDGTDGMAFLEVRGTAKDLMWFNAMVHHIADLLALEGDTDPAGARRATAVGVLGNPAQALMLLNRHHAPDPAEPDLGERDRDPATSSPPDDSCATMSPASPATKDSPDGPAGWDPVWDRLPVWTRRRRADDPPPDPPPDPPDDPSDHERSTGDGGSGDPTSSGPLGTAMPRPRSTDGWPAIDPPPAPDPEDEPPPPVDPEEDPVSVQGRLARLLADQTKIIITAPPERLIPSTVLYVHLSEDTLRDGDGVVRVEKVGPVTLQQARGLLAGTRVRLTPVIDNSVIGPVVDAYEATARMRETVVVRDSCDVFPFGAIAARSCDLDHAVGYQRTVDGAPAAPAQTRPDNLDAVSRTAHRAKNHGGWRRTNWSLGSTEWLSPHGDLYRVERGLTTWLGRATPTRIAAIDATAHLVPAPFRTRVEGLVSGAV